MAQTAQLIRHIDTGISFHQGISMQITWVVTSLRMATCFFRLKYKQVGQRGSGWVDWVQLLKTGTWVGASLREANFGNWDQKVQSGCGLGAAAGNTANIIQHDSCSFCCRCTAYWRPFAGTH